jgi:hypothetical protein
MQNQPSRYLMEQFIRDSRRFINPLDFPEFHARVSGNPATEYAEWMFIGFNRLFKRLGPYELHDLFITLWLIWKYLNQDGNDIVLRRLAGGPTILFSGMQSHVNEFVTLEVDRWTTISTRAQAISLAVNSYPGLNLQP